MKRKERYRYALQFARAQFALADAEVRYIDPEISMSHSIVLEAASRYQLTPPQTRRLVSALRKDLNG